MDGRSAHELKKQLRITFIGEDGIDEGGVQKEFFQIAMNRIFDSEYGIFLKKFNPGMFHMNPDSRLCWFTLDPSRDKDTLDEYRLLGNLIGLALYNGIVLDIKFPLAMYKKLQNQPTCLADLHELDPVSFLIIKKKPLARGLESLLDFEGNVQETFEQSFEIQFDSFLGHRIAYELKPLGATLPVTNENRKGTFKH